MNRIGIDLGGTKIEAILLSSANKVVERMRIPTNQKDGYEAIIERIINLTKKVRAKTKHECSIGICTPGSLDMETGVLKNSNTVCLIGKPIKSDLENALNCPIEIDNDANCFAMAEAILGAGKNYAVVFGVIIGTGVGGGIILNRRIHHGRLFIAGEWGHQILHPNGKMCYCGKMGCVETYLSGPSLENYWVELGGKPLSLGEIIKSFEHNQNAKYLKWKKEYLANFGMALSNVINIIDPDAVILGGGVSNISFLYDEGITAVKENIFSLKKDTPILQNKLGDSAGVFGAALLEKD